MQYIPVKTRIMQPPKDDLYDLLDEYLIGVQEGDMILITSKIIAIHQGRCAPLTEDKRALVEKEAEAWIEGNKKYAASPLSVKYNALFYAAGIDESNSGDYYTFLPEHPYETAREIWKYITEKHCISNVGVIITDSHTQPLRWGVQGISIGSWGFVPVNHHRGKKDLFGRELKLTSTNIPDSIAAGGTILSGEADECTPIIIVRDVPEVVFTAEDRRNDLLVDAEDDLFYPMLKLFYEQD